MRLALFAGPHRKEDREHVRVARARRGQEGRGAFEPKVPAVARVLGLVHEGPGLQQRLHPGQSAPGGR